VNKAVYRLRNASHTLIQGKIIMLDSVILPDLLALDNLIFPDYKFQYKCDKYRAMPYTSSHDIIFKTLS
jgi:hypothetical protein